MADFPREAGKYKKNSARMREKDKDALKYKQKTAIMGQHILCPLG